MGANSRSVKMLKREQGAGSREQVYAFASPAPRSLLPAPSVAESRVYPRTNSGRVSYSRRGRKRAAGDLSLSRSRRVVILSAAGAKDLLPHLSAPPPRTTDSSHDPAAIEWFRAVPVCGGRSRDSAFAGKPA